MTGTDNDFSFDKVIFTPGISCLLQHARPGKGERVLDVAAGSGIPARLLGSTAGHLTSVDIGPNILKKARALYAGSVPAAWVRADAAHLPFVCSSFDLVLCHQGLQFFTHHDKALSEMGRVLAPGGRLALMVWGRVQDCAPYAALVETLENTLGARAAEFARRPFSLSDRRELVDQLEGVFGDVETVSIRVEVDLPSPGAFARAFLSYLPRAATDDNDPRKFTPAVVSGVSELLGRGKKSGFFMSAVVAVCRQA